MTQAFQQVHGKAAPGAQDGAVKTQVQTGDLDAAGEKTTALKSDLSEVGQSVTRPRIDATQIDRAIKRADLLQQRIKALANPARTGVPSPGPGGGPAIQKRAVGGSFGRGWLMTGEQGPELEYRDRGGWILHNRGLQQMMALSQRVRHNISSTPAFRIASARPRVAAGAGGGGGGGRSLSIGDIHVHAAPGMDVNALARATRDQVKRAMGGDDADLHDGGLYA
ncbi:hypothetical protein HKX54_03765 [Sulfitobacter sp. M57]|uniref:hypothetical protein n=1 Tax=unclassified Sulfitobacter TaxID=196795 RepID=UPI0023E0E043|nr:MULTISPECIES: hypothetical protein [unclassified Sulfitobacter]MDF3413562.1 hypothetical protein [Sulfitobacter sp. KE5]MDF3421156.1 hypothetical protein [Sulfitobacter sp. KE43]MDF3432109.1 hypothetical protein [Sulfitobacter sp. KE42]MDF3457749.1 hypothetical protein [Sulfitobacter sp. S74]MDF3461650.1 hypothetical protein [Sulfitobacter sp. Ks18]